MARAEVAAEAIDAMASAVVAYELAASAADAGMGGAVSSRVADLNDRASEFAAKARRAEDEMRRAQGDLERARTRVSVAERDNAVARANPNAARGDGVRARAEMDRAYAELRRAETALSDARREAEEARRRAERAQAIVGDVRGAVDSWQGSRAQWRVARGLLVGRARVRLRQAGRDLAAYEALASGAAGFADGGVDQSVGAVAAGGSGSADAGLPAGFALVPVASIDLSASPVTGVADFLAAYPAADLTWAAEKFFEVILPALRRGETRDDLVARDAATGQHGMRSLADTFDGFLGAESPVLRRLPGDRFQVENGYRRIWCVQQLGYDEIPARIE